jgi:hypothetical protein
MCSYNEDVSIENMYSYNEKISLKKNDLKIDNKKYTELIFSVLIKILSIVPEQRICQIISNAVSMKTKNNDIFYCTNTELLDCLKDYLELLKKKKG